ncbi:MAG: glycosyltransferase [Proteobacteria bacterium]|nr:glycosyltransferase [Pseudomonadota bacterium]
MSKSWTGARVLIYSHDSFGLGHLRRCRAIAHSLVSAYKDLSVLILSGSPIIGSFEFRTRVDFVRVPGVIKLRNGDYTSLSLHIDITQTIALRSSIVRHTAEIFDPDVFIVDKEPLGLRGEVRETLEVLHGRGTTLVLGLRDVMDEPSQLAPEWERKNAASALKDFYDEIWIYGLPQICEPLAGIDLPHSVQRKITYTGYLGRQSDGPSASSPQHNLIDEPYLLVTPGGGGDGMELVDWVLAAYESDPTMPYNALIVMGPFMQRDDQADFLARAERLPKVSAITFEARIEELIRRASGVVAMGGYNTFCEILSFDKPSIIVPRVMPRLEQYIRASRAAELGLVTMLPIDGPRDPRVMATALRHLPQQPRPSEVVIPGLLDGLENVNRLVARRIEAGMRPRVGLAHANS